MSQKKFEDYQKKLLEAFNKKNILCPQCKKDNYALLPGFINQPIQKELMAGLVIGGQGIPLVAFICLECGRVDYYAVKILLPEIEI
jgi:hypothetical protein